MERLRSGDNLGRPKKGDESLIVLSLRIERSMVEEIDRVVKQYKTLSRTEFIRMAIEFAISRDGFVKTLKDLD